MAVAGLVLGIVAIVTSFIPCIGMLGFVPGVLGIIFSIIGLGQAKTTGQGKGMAMAGLILSIIAVIWIPIAEFVLFAAAGSAVAALPRV